MVGFEGEMEVMIISKESKSNGDRILIVFFFVVVVVLFFSVTGYEALGFFLTLKIIRFLFSFVKSIILFVVEFVVETIVK